MVLNTLKNIFFFLKKRNFINRTAYIIFYKSPFRRLVDTKLYSKLYEKRVKNKAGNLKYYYLNIETTNFCNAKCIMCPHSIMKRKKSTMTLKDFKKYIDRIFPYVKFKNVCLSGFGEPLLDPTITEKIKYLKTKYPKVNVEMYTNGFMLTEENTKKIIDSGLDELNISFNGGNKKAYEKVMHLDFKISSKRIIDFLKYKKKIKAKKPVVKISMVVLRENKDSAKDLIEKFKKLANSVVIKYPINWAGDVEVNKLRKQKKTKSKWACKGIWTTVDIQADGKIIPCCRDYEQKVVLGDLNKKNIKEILESKPYKRFKEMHLKKQFDKIPLCKNCDTLQYNSVDWW